MAARHDAPRAASELMRQILVEQKRTNRLMQALLIFGLAVGVGRSSRACCWRSRTAHDRKQGDVDPKQPAIPSAADFTTRDPGNASFWDERFGVA